MQAFVSSLTAAALLAHAIVGCHGHHGLACSESEPSVSLAICCNHDDDHDHDAPADHHSPSKRCPCELACHSGCVTLPPQKTQLDAGALDVSLDLVAAEPTATGQITGHQFTWKREQHASLHGPALGLHLLKQSLLI